MLGAILGSAITLAVIIYVGGGDISSLVPQLPHLFSPDVTSLTYVDQLRIQRLIEKNIIFSADDMLGQIGTFYSTIIVFLIAIITVMSLFTLFFVKASAEEKAEAQAKVVARQAVADKVDPKIEQVDMHLSKFSDVELKNKIDDLLRYKVLESIRFWEKIDESIYRKVEEFSEDSNYNTELINRQLQSNTESIKNISSTIQQLNDSIDSLNSNVGDNDDVVEIDMDADTEHGNSH